MKKFWNIICPTCVGMNRPQVQSLQSMENMPHMRGDEPVTLYFRMRVLIYAPHAWG